MNTSAKKNYLQQRKAWDEIKYVSKALSGEKNELQIKQKNRQTAGLPDDLPTSAAKMSVLKHQGGGVRVKPLLSVCGGVCGMGVCWCA